MPAKPAHRHRLKSTISRRRKTSTTSLVFRAGSFPSNLTRNGVSVCLAGCLPTPPTRQPRAAYEKKFPRDSHSLHFQSSYSPHSARSSTHQCTYVSLASGKGMMWVYRKDGKLLGSFRSRLPVTALAQISTNGVNSLLLSFLWLRERDGSTSAVWAAHYRRSTGAAKLDADLAKVTHHISLLRLLSVFSLRLWNLYQK